MPTYRSRTTTQGRNMAGARALWRATGMKDDDFNKPIAVRVSCQLGPHGVFLADQQHPDAIGAGRLQRAGNLVLRRVVSAHGVYGDGDHLAIDQDSGTSMTSRPL